MGWSLATPRLRATVAQGYKGEGDTCTSTFSVGRVALPCTVCQPLVLLSGGLGSGAGVPIAGPLAYRFREQPCATAAPGSR
eukprot:9334543-Alexandrium_andersonii.AAC.1